MKCYKPNTDQTCEVYLSTGGKRYAEYIKDPELDDRPHKPHVLECFIPIAAGERITVNINFGGTVLHGAADVIADGAFVFDRRIEGDKYGRVKFQKRNWKLEDFYNVPAVVDDEALQAGKGVLGGQLVVKSLDDGDVPLYVKNGGKLGLGSVAVILSVNQHTTESYTHKYQHQTVGKWRDIPTNYADGGIKPLHELDFILEDDEVHFNRQARHKRHLDQTRFGHKAWAVFVFHYRPLVDIQAAGCTPRPDLDRALEPFLGEFIFADPDAIMKKRLATRAKNEREKMEAEEGSFDGNDGFSGFSSSAGDGEREEGLFVSRSPSQGAWQMPKTKLFGNPLETSGAPSYGARRDSRIPEHHDGTASQDGFDANEDWQGLFGDDAAGDGRLFALTQQAAATAAQPQNSIPSNLPVDNFDFNFYPDLAGDELSAEIDQALLAGGFNTLQAPAAAPVAKMVASSPEQVNPASFEHQGAGDVVQSVEVPHHTQRGTIRRHPENDAGDVDEEEEPSELAGMVSNAVQNKVDDRQAAKIARKEARAVKKQRPPPQPKGKPVFDPTAKTGYGYGNPKMTPKPSMPPTQRAMQQVDAQGTGKKGMMQNYLQSQANGQQDAQTSKGPAAPYRRPWETETAQPAPRTQHPMSPPNKPAQPASVGSNNARPTLQPAQATPRVHAPSIPHKRSPSVTSHDSTPSKKARAADQSARKAALQARLAQAQKDKSGNQQQLENERRAREELERRNQEEERKQREQEEAEEAEIAAMEAELMEVEGQTAAIQETRKKEAEEARMRELERQREGEE